MTDIVPPLITGGALVVVNGVIIAIQGYRRRQDQLDHEKEAAKSALAAKAEELFLAIKHILTHFERLENVQRPTSAQMARDVVEAAKPDMIEVQMLLALHFPFLAGVANEPGELLKTVHAEIDEYGALARDRLLEWVEYQGTEQKSPVKTAYGKLRTTFKTCGDDLTSFLSDLPKLDLYQLHTEWKEQQARRK